MFTVAIEDIDNLNIVLSAFTLDIGVCVPILNLWYDIYSQAVSQYLPVRIMCVEFKCECFAKLGQNFEFCVLFDIF
jgi:hypothetical protein